MILFFLFCINSVAQDCKNEKQWQYFGMNKPGMIPELFAPDIISTEMYEFGGTFSPDGKEYFFTRRPNYESSKNRIYHTRFLNGKWTMPVLATFSQDYFEFEPMITPDGEKLYFYSERPQGRNSQFDGDLWVCKKENEQWGEPHFFLSPVNKKWCMGVSSSKNGNLFFTANHKGKRGVFKSIPVNGDYKKIVYLNDSINSAYYSHPFIASDESFIIMDGQPTGRGKSELFVSFRKPDGSYSTPKNLGPVVNSTKTEFGGSVSPDGKYLFFHRRVNDNGDIYWVDIEIIYRLN